MDHGDAVSRKWLVPRKNWGVSFIGREWIQLRWSLILCLAGLLFPGGVGANDLPSAEGPVGRVEAINASQADGHEIYGALYLLGALAQNRPLMLGGESLGGTVVRNGAGTGFRAGIFPAFAHSIIGIQADTFGMGNDLSLSSTSSSVGGRSARGTILSGNTLVSLVARYPGEWFQPYLGAGIGVSSALLVGTELIHGASKQTGTARDTSFAHQYFAGLRANLTAHFFIFGEYKWFSTRYAWNGELAPSLDYRVHIVAFGGGMSF